jgi:hypothetical protein
VRRRGRRPPRPARGRRARPELGPRAALASSLRVGDAAEQHEDGHERTGEQQAEEPDHHVEPLLESPKLSSIVGDRPRRCSRGALRHGAECVGRIGFAVVVAVDRRRGWCRCRGGGRVVVHGGVSRGAADAPHGERGEQADADHDGGSGEGLGDGLCGEGLLRVEQGGFEAGVGERRQVDRRAQRSKRARPHAVSADSPTLRPSRRTTITTRRGGAALVGRGVRRRRRSWWGRRSARSRRRACRAGRRTAGRRCRRPGGAHPRVRGGRHGDADEHGWLDTTQRSVQRPPRYEVIAIAAVSAESTQPGITAARSRSTSTELMNSGTSTIAITRPAPTTKLTTSAITPVAAPEQPRIEQGMGLRRCCHTNARPRRSRHRVQPAQVGPRPAGELVEPVDALDLGRAEQCEVERHQRHGEQRAPSQSMRDPCAGRSWPDERPPRHRQPDDRPGDVEPELPLPRQEPHEQGAVEGPHTQPIVSMAPSVPSARARRPVGVGVADDREGDRHHGATADRREDPAEDEPGERFVELTDSGMRMVPARKSRYAATKVRRRPITSLRRPAIGIDRDERDEVGVDHPRGVVEAVGQDETEVADDRPQHRGHDREVVGGDEHAEPDDGQDQPGEGSPGDGRGGSRGLVTPSRSSVTSRPHVGGSIVNSRRSGRARGPRWSRSSSIVVVELGGGDQGRARVDPQIDGHVLVATRPTVMSAT